MEINQIAYRHRLNCGIPGILLSSDQLIQILRQSGCIVKSYRDGWDELSQYDDLAAKTRGATAMSCLLDDIPHVYYSALASESRLRFALSHELGHVIQGHIWRDKQEAEHETDANQFALAFLAPICYLSTLHISSVQDIQEITGLETEKCEILFGRLLDYEKTPKEFSATEKSLVDLLSPPKPKNKSLLEYVSGNITGVIVVAMCCIVFVIVGVIKLCKDTPVSDPSPSIPQSITQVDPDTLLSSAPDSKASYTESANESSTVPASELKVYATPSGKKYHLEDCQYLKGKENLREMTISEAKQAGLTPCSVCNPDEN